MRVRAEIPFIDETVNVVVEMSDEDEQERSDYVRWEYPLCETRLVRGGEQLDVGWLSLMELLSFLHLPLRRNEWPTLPETQLGHSFLSLCVGSFTPEDGDIPHQMQVRHEGGAFRIAFSEERAEQWAVSVWEIKERLKVFLQYR